jgi:hypothetical protein
MESESDDERQKACCGISKHDRSVTGLCTHGLGTSVKTTPNPLDWFHQLITISHSHSRPKSTFTHRSSGRFSDWTCVQSRSRQHGVSKTLNRDLAAAVGLSAQ